MRTIEINRIEIKVSLKTQTLATIAAIIAAIALPQALHVVGKIFGVNTVLGEILLPMHLPVILVGLLAGPVVGVITGMCAPLLSYYLTGMPTIIMLPIITIELLGYGLSAGLMKNIKMSTVAKVLLVQVIGRIFRTLATLFIIYIINAKAPAISSIWTSISTGIIGIVVQLITLPLIVRWIGKVK